MSQNPKVILQTNLDSLSAGDLAKCLRLVPPDFAFDPETHIDLESCVQLRVPETTAILNLESVKGDVCRVQVISQCRRAEVYQGRLREYSSTVNASFVDSSEDEEGDEAMSIFKLDIDLRNEKNSCSQVQLKLTGLSSICWLMGVFVSLQETSSSKPTAFVGSHFDLDQVNQMLDSKKLSQSATKFKGLFETFNKGHPNGAAGNSNQPQSLDDLLSSSQTAQELQIMSLMSGHLPKRQAAKGISSGSVEVANPAESSNLKISQCEKCSSDLQAIERRIMQRLSQMEQTQNEKFDQLTQLIQSIKKD